MHGRRVENRKLDKFGEGTVAVLHVKLNNIGVRERVACVADHGQPEIVGFEQVGDQLPSVGPADEVPIRASVQR